MKQREDAPSFLSVLGGKLLAGKKAREDAERNRKRLEEAALAARELGAQRITDNEIKKITARLAYEADSYIAAARESDGACYDALVLDALDTARAAVNAWKKNEDQAAALKFMPIDGGQGGIVIPRETTPIGAVAGDGGAGQNTGSGQSREKTLGILRESLRPFIIQNSIRNAGDPEAALADLADEERKS